MTTGENTTPGTPAAGTGSAQGRPPAALFGFAWLWVGVPMAYGVYELILKVAKLFTGG